MLLFPVMYSVVAFQYNMYVSLMLSFLYHNQIEELLECAQKDCLDVDYKVNKYC